MLRSTIAAVLCLIWTATLAADEKAPIRFEDVTQQMGLIEPLAGMMGHGGAWGDYDGDGWVDLFVGGFCDRPNDRYAPADGPVPCRLMRNVEGQRFESAQQPAVETYGRASGAVFADLDNNGTQELFVANNAHRQLNPKLTDPQQHAQVLQAILYRNDAGKLVDISKQSGASPSELFTARNVGVLDYDNDGLLDLFINEDYFVKRGTTPRSVMLKNMGDLKFKDVNKELGIPDGIYGLGLAVADLNDDLRPDFFVAHSDRLFLSQPDGTYREAVELSPVFAFETIDKHEEWPCGAAFNDLNRDGNLDLVLTIHLDTARNRLFLNDGLKNGIPQFREVTKEAGLGKPALAKCPHVELQDFDNDGWPDIYMSAGWLKDDHFEPLFYRHTGKLKDGVPQYEPLRKIEGEMVYYPAGPTADYDKDGRLDIFLINWYEGNHSRLLRNVAEPRHWLDVRVEGRNKVNRQGIGSQVKVYEAGKLGQKDALLGFQEVTTDYGYASGQEAVCHFGLGDTAKVDLAIRLPSGQTIEKRDVAADQRLTIEEP